MDGGAAIHALGGLGLFLMGMTVMCEALRALAGSRLRAWLLRFTRTPLSGALIGAATTAALQSSSATTVATVGFVQAGLISFPSSLGIIFGANVGSTGLGWLVALLGLKLDLAGLMPPLIAIGAWPKAASPWRASGCSSWDRHPAGGHGGPWGAPATGALQWSQRGWAPSAGFAWPADHRDHPVIGGGGGHRAHGTHRRSDRSGPGRCAGDRHGRGHHDHRPDRRPWRQPQRPADGRGPPGLQPVHGGDGLPAAAGLPGPGPALAGGADRRRSRIRAHRLPHGVQPAGGGPAAALHPVFCPPDPGAPALPGRACGR